MMKPDPHNYNVKRLTDKLTYWLSKCPAISRVASLTEKIISIFLPYNTYIFIYTSLSLDEN